MGIRIIEPSIESMEIKNADGVIVKDTFNTNFTYLGELIVKKEDATNYFITTWIDNGAGTLNLYNFTTKTNILTILVNNTTKELKTGSISQNNLVAGNNIIELWGKNTAGTINISFFKIETQES